MYKRERRGLVSLIIILAAVTTAVCITDRIPGQPIDEAIAESARLRAEEDSAHTAELKERKAEREAKAAARRNSKAGHRKSGKRKTADDKKHKTDRPSTPPAARNPLDDVVPSDR